MLAKKHVTSSFPCLISLVSSSFTYMQIIHTGAGAYAKPAAAGQLPFFYLEAPRMQNPKPTSNAPS